MFNGIRQHTNQIYQTCGWVPCFIFNQHHQPLYINIDSTDRMEKPVASVQYRKWKIQVLYPSIVQSASFLSPPKFSNVISSNSWQISLNKKWYITRKQSGYTRRATLPQPSIFLRLKDDIPNAMKKEEVSLAILVDFSKAFDTVDYRILLKEL